MSLVLSPRNHSALLAQLSGVLDSVKDERQANLLREALLQARRPLDRAGGDFLHGLRSSLQEWRPTLVLDEEVPHLDCRRCWSMPRHHLGPAARRAWTHCCPVPSPSSRCSCPRMRTTPPRRSSWRPCKCRRPMAARCPPSCSACPPTGTAAAKAPKPAWCARAGCTRAAAVVWSLHCLAAVPGRTDHHPPSASAQAHHAAGAHLQGEHGGAAAPGTRRIRGGYPDAKPAGRAVDRGQTRGLPQPRSPLGSPRGAAAAASAPAARGGWGASCVVCAQGCGRTSGPQGGPAAQVSRA
jgi:hypothetical protein